MRRLKGVLKGGLALSLATMLMLSCTSCGKEQQVIDDYGVQTAAALDRLICDNHINDLHTGNVGYINNHIVLVDYSGYGYYAEQQNEDWYDVCA